MLINSLYGMKMTIDKDIAKKHKSKLEKAIETLGNKYRLLNPVKKGENK
jgi:hypothetical protein